MESMIWLTKAFNVYPVSSSIQDRMYSHSCLTPVALEWKAGCDNKKLEVVLIICVEIKWPWDKVMALWLFGVENV